MTSFSAGELTPRVGGPVIPLVDWRQASKVSLQSVCTDPAMLERCECDLPVASSEAVVISSESEGENEAPEVWVSNGAYSLSHSDRQLVLSKRGWLTDEIISAAQSLLLQFYPSMAGLQPPVLQKVNVFQVHSGEFVQIIHMGNSHWCVVSTVGCEPGVVQVYDSLYKTLSEETLCVIASLVYSPSRDLKITMMDVGKQSNGSDCGVLAIAYAFDICSGSNPCTVRFDHSNIRSHLATCLETCSVSRFPVSGERNSVQRKLVIVELHCSCRIPNL